jgi:hypothetical protein
MKIGYCISLALVVGVQGFFTPAPVSRHHLQHGGAHAALQQQVLKARSVLSMAGSGTLISSNEELLPGIAAIDAANDNLFGKLEALRAEPYFSLYSVDILASCEYIPQELFECYSQSCEIYPVDEEEVSTARSFLLNVKKQM